jgi:DNA-binding NarL/FixJ family response regulator
MLFGAHVYARAKVFPDVALSKGEEAYAAARTLGDRALEFAVAGSMAMSQVEIGAVEEAERWLGRAATIASAEPTALRARQLEAWRGIVRSAAGDAAGMREHLGRAIQFATEHGGPAARCEMLAQLALEAARLGAERRDEDLLAVAERSANDAKALTSILPGHPPWSARANAALARVAMARGRLETAAEFGRAALAELDGAMREDLHLDIFLSAADAILAAGSEQEAIALRERLSLMLALLAQRILDEDVRVRWFRGPFGRELTRLVGAREIQQGTAVPAQAAIPLSEAELRLLQLLTEGRTNREIAEETGVTEQSITRQLAELFVKIGASSRADATAIALMGKLV